MKLIFTVSVLERIHITHLSFCSNNSYLYVDDRKTGGIQLIRYGFYLLESGKIILANNFIFYSNTFLYACTPSNSVNICREWLPTNKGYYHASNTTKFGSYKETSRKIDTCSSNNDSLKDTGTNIDENELNSEPLS